LAAANLAPRHPWLAGLALAITSFKPTFGVPLGILLLAAGYYRTVLVGWGIGFVIGMGGVLWIFANSGDLDQLPFILRHNVEVLNSDPLANALSTPIRIDAAGTLERLAPVQGESVSLIATLIVLLITCSGLVLLRKVRDTAEGHALLVAIVSAGTVACLFHVTYDALIFWGGIFVLAVASRKVWQTTSVRWRWSVVGLLLIPMFNIFGSQALVNRYDQWFPWLNSLPDFWKNAGWTLVCTLNGLALLVAIILMTVQAFRIRTARPA